MFLSNEYNVKAAIVKNNDQQKTSAKQQDERKDFR